MHKRLAFPLGVALVMTARSASGGAVEHDHHSHLAAPQANIEILINPEGKVSADVGSEPAPDDCNRDLDISVMIRNDGFVTAPLKVEAISPADKALHVLMIGGALTGRSVENRIIRLSGLRHDVDVTLAFHFPPAEADVAGRDQVHLYLTCRRN